MAKPLADPLRPHEEAVALPAGFDAEVWFIGRIHTPWARRNDCPKRGDPESGPRGTEVAPISRTGLRRC